MEINDYSKRLAESRDNYMNSKNELRENYRKDVERLEDLHDKKTDNQQKNYIAKKMEIEDRVEDNLKRYDKSLKDELKTRTDRYNKNMSDEKEKFALDRKNQMTEYNTKLDAIKKSFDTAAIEKDKLHKLFKENTEERYEEGLTAREKDFNTKVSDVTKQATKSMNESRDQANFEKKRLLSRHSSEKQQLVQDANIARNKANSAHQLQIETLRSAQDQELRQSNNHHMNRMENMLANKNNEQEVMRKNFADLTQNIQERNTSALSSLNRENQAEKRLLEKDFANDRISLERQTNKLLNEGAGNKVESGLERQAEAYDNRIKTLRDEMQQLNYNNQFNNERIASDHQDEVKKNEIIKSKELAMKDADMRELRQIEIGGMKDRVDKFREHTSRKIANLERQNEEQSVESRQTLKNALDEKKVEYQRQMNIINDKNMENVENLKESYAKEQTKYFQKVKRDTHNEIEDLKDDMNARFARKEDSLNKQVAFEQDNLKRQEEAYESRLTNMKKKSAKEIEEIKVLAHENRLEDRRSMDRELKMKQREFEKTLQSYKAEFDRKISKTKNHNDIQVAKLTERYESQIDRERQEAGKTLKLQTDMLKEEYRRLVEKSKMEKDSIRNQYELKMEKLRQDNVRANMIKETRKNS